MLVACSRPARNAEPQFNAPPEGAAARPQRNIARHVLVGAAQAIKSPGPEARAGPAQRACVHEHCRHVVRGCRLHRPDDGEVVHVLAIAENIMTLDTRLAATWK